MLRGILDVDKISLDTLDFVKRKISIYPVVHDCDEPTAVLALLHYVPVPVITYVGETEQIVVLKRLVKLILRPSVRELQDDICLALLEKSGAQPDDEVVDIDVLDSLPDFGGDDACPHEDFSPVQSAKRQTLGQFELVPAPFIQQCRYIEVICFRQAEISEHERYDAIDAFETTTVRKTMPLFEAHRRFGWLGISNASGIRIWSACIAISLLITLLALVSFVSVLLDHSADPEKLPHLETSSSRG